MSDQTTTVASSYIRDESPARNVEPIERRRRSATNRVLAMFEELIEPLIPDGNDEAVKSFKETVRKKINGVAFEGIQAVRAAPGESINGVATDLAETYAFPDDDRSP